MMMRCLFVSLALLTCGSAAAGELTVAGTRFYRDGQPFAYTGVSFFNAIYNTNNDMFQTGYGTPACPPSGIPDPEFSPYHRQVFEFLKLRDRYVK